uniref:Chalcone isomerase domain-containing protein n=1 Tax=Kalanchoe fedtschenkoi TaxID=63787 RepID=A0A7N0T3W5_KALFE
MVSLRFPFSFSQPSPKSASHFAARSLTAACVAVAAATAVGGAVVVSATAKESILQNALAPGRNNCAWASLSLADSEAPASQSKAGASFPAVLGDSKRLLGVGLRRKSVFGLKNIDVYAYGVYADENDVRKVLGGKFGNQSISSLQDGKDLNEEILEGDVPVTVRLQIVYSRLSIGSVRSAFKESVGSRLQKFGGPGNKELLDRFTSQFKDEYKIPKGAVIDLSREKGYVLRTTIDGTEVGSIQSKLLCKSILDLYIGEDPFDQQAKEEIQLKLVNILHKRGGGQVSVVLK